MDPTIFNFIIKNRVEISYNLLRIFIRKYVFYMYKNTYTYSNIYVYVVVEIYNLKIGRDEI